MHLCSAISDHSINTFLKWKIAHHGPVWYFQMDTPRSLFKLDYVQKMIGAGLNLNDVHIADRDMEDFPFPFNIVDPRSQDWLKRAIRSVTADQRPVAIVLDTLRMLHNTDENDATAVTSVMKMIEDCLRIEEVWGEKKIIYKPAQILISHEKKLQDDAAINVVGGNRGSNAVAGAMDCIIRVGRNELKLEGRSIPAETVHCQMLPSGKWMLDGKTREATETDEKVLSVLTGPMTNGEWEAKAIAAGVKEGTFKKALTRIKDKGEVNYDGTLYCRWE